jgi:hypothetical protein
VPEYETHDDGDDDENAEDKDDDKGELGSFDGWLVCESDFGYFSGWLVRTGIFGYFLGALFILSMIIYDHFVRFFLLCFFA